MVPTTDERSARKQAADTTLDTPSTESHPNAWTPTLRVVFSGHYVVQAAARALASGDTPVGREVASGGILLEDPHASRLHGRLRIDLASKRATWTNESRHGSMVNGADVEPSVDLDDGSVLALGRTLLVFRWAPRPMPDDVPAEGLIGDAPSMREIRALIPGFARTEATVMVTGETGTGKEVVARAIHQASQRSGPFIAVNAATIPEALAEGQLFGHAAGAFTGANKTTDGFFRAATDGTLFLDEIGELSASVQTKLLRALETGSVVPVGTFREVPHRARVIVATHRDLIDAVRLGSFRSDLYARIGDLVVPLPPLRARREDILAILADAWKGSMPPMSSSLARAVVFHSWPLNVRELVRLVTQLQVGAQRTGASKLSLDLVRDALARTEALSTDRPISTDQPSTGPRMARDDSGDQPPPDRAALETLLRAHRGVVSRVATVVGRSRKQVYRWVQEHGIDLDLFRDGSEDG